MPYRIDISGPPPDAVDRLVELGALDIEQVGGALAAIMPDSVTPATVAGEMHPAAVTVSEAVARDNGSVWLLSPRAVRIGSIVVAPDGPATPGALRLKDSAAFGTGHHPTTALCIEALEEALRIAVPDSVLDVGTGTGVLALAALRLGVPKAVGIDIDAEALKTAAEHAQLNNLADRLQLFHGGPGVIEGTWQLVVSNVLAAPLIEMAPAIVRRVGNGGRLIVSGVPHSLESEVRQAYERLGMRHLRSENRAGWAALVFQSSW